MKYMIIIQDNNTIITGKTKTELKKAYIEMIKSIYEAYIDACKETNETPISKQEFKSYYSDEVELYNEAYINNEFMEVA